jgi:hypothetical protein
MRPKRDRSQLPLAAILQTISRLRRRQHQGFLELHNLPDTIRIDDFDARQQSISLLDIDVSMRVESVILASSIGTFRSARTSTLLPATSTSSSVRNTNRPFSPRMCPTVAFLYHRTVPRISVRPALVGRFTFSIIPIHLNKAIRFIINSHDRHLDRRRWVALLATRSVVAGGVGGRLGVDQRPRFRAAARRSRAQLENQRIGLFGAHGHERESSTLKGWTLSTPTCLAGFSQNSRRQRLGLSISPIR